MITLLTIVIALIAAILVIKKYVGKIPDRVVKTVACKVSRIENDTLFLDSPVGVLDFFMSERLKTFNLAIGDDVIVEHYDNGLKSVKRV
ncbi:MAG: hypothetical protein JSS79_05190 [Bacteroidetes bacterium]|nr:hypothetical protein [Bacteroidota bacterium]